MTLDNYLSLTLFDIHLPNLSETFTPRVVFTAEGRIAKENVLKEVAEVAIRRACDVHESPKDKEFLDFSKVSS